MYNFLVIDDEEDIREIIKMALEEEFECHIDVAKDGLDAFVFARERFGNNFSVKFYVPS